MRKPNLKQFEAIEAALQEQETPSEKPHERHERKVSAIMEVYKDQEVERFMQCLYIAENLVPKWVFDKLLPEIKETGEDGRLYDYISYIGIYGSWRKDVNFSALFTMLLTVAQQIYKEKLFSVIPEELCRWFDVQEVKDFCHQTEGDPWYYWRWLDADVCGACGLPLPTRSTKEKPFPICPACGGEAQHHFQSGFNSPEQTLARREYREMNEDEKGSHDQILLSCKEWASAFVTTLPPDRNEIERKLFPSFF